MKADNKALQKEVDTLKPMVRDGDDTANKLQS